MSHVQSVQSHSVQVMEDEIARLQWMVVDGMLQERKPTENEQSHVNVIRVTTRIDVVCVT